MAFLKPLTFKESEKCMKSTAIPIQVKLGKKQKPADLLARLNAVLAGVYGNPVEFPAPPIDQATFKSNIDVLTTGVTAALDGGLKALAARDSQAVVGMTMLHQVGHYVEVACKGDMSTFLKSGFEARSTSKGAVQSLSQFIRSIKPGSSSGQMLVTLVGDPSASYRELRWTVAGSGGTLGPWTIIPVTRTRPATSVTGLTPGTTYVFQVRSLTDAGYSDWSDSITKICT
jgi:hypothetical protein